MHACDWAPYSEHNLDTTHPLALPPPGTSPPFLLLHPHLQTRWPFPTLPGCWLTSLECVLCTVSTTGGCLVPC